VVFGCAHTNQLAQFDRNGVWCLVLRTPLNPNNLIGTACGMWLCAHHLVAFDVEALYSVWICARHSIKHSDRNGVWRLVVCVHLVLRGLTSKLLQAVLTLRGLSFSNHFALKEEKLLQPFCITKKVRFIFNVKKAGYQCAL
jgi:hypothetical protein